MWQLLTERLLYDRRRERHWRSGFWLDVLLRFALQVCVIHVSGCQASLRLPLLTLPLSDPNKQRSDSDLLTTFCGLLGVVADQSSWHTAFYPSCSDLRDRELTEL